jgi:hypothetical protein
MAKKSRMAVLKRQRELRKAEKAALKREKKARRTEEAAELGPSDQTPTQEDLQGYGLAEEEEEL